MEFLNFSISKKLKEKGFNEECLCHYIGEDLVYNIESPIANNQIWFCHNKYDNIWHRDNVDAPTISQVLDWLRTNHGIYVRVDLWKRGWYFDVISYEYDESCGEYDVVTKHQSEDYKSYDEAAIMGAKYVLDNLI